MRLNEVPYITLPIDTNKAVLTVSYGDGWKSCLWQFPYHKWDLYDLLLNQG